MKENIQNRQLMQFMQTINGPWQRRDIHYTLQGDPLSAPDLKRLTV